MRPTPCEAYWKEFQVARGTPENEYPKESFDCRSVDKLTWDPDKIARMMVEVGARYIVWSADSASHFLLHTSKYVDIPGSPSTYLKGPGANQVDYTLSAIGEMRDAGQRMI
jgi:hypothetical protein